MNDTELFDTIHEALVIDSPSAISAVRTRGTQLMHRRQALTIGAGTVAVAAAVAVTVPSLTSGSSSSPSAGGSTARAESPKFVTAAYELAAVSPSTVKVSLKQTAALANPTLAADLQKALVAEGVPAVVRYGPQSCAYQTTTDLPALEKAVQWDIDGRIDNSRRGDYTTISAAAGASLVPFTPPDPADPNTLRTVKTSDFDNSGLDITASALPAGTTLQIWFANPDPKGDLFSILPAGAPHC